MKKPIIYLIGSLKNEKIPHIANDIRKLGFEVFDDWFSPGPEADDFWRKYEKVRGSTYKQALKNYAGKHIFEFDSFHVDRADVGILVMPAGKSGHLELGVMIGQGKPCYVFFDKEPERWDVMYQFAKEVCFNFDELKEELEKLLVTPDLFQRAKKNGQVSKEELINEILKINPVSTVESNDGLIWVTDVVKVISNYNSH